mgnify:CR=1 FL=1
MSPFLRCLLCLALAVSAGGCTSTPAAWLRTYGLAEQPRPEGLTVCTSFACVGTARTALTPEEWERVRALFVPDPSDAAAERATAARAVGLLEEMVGAKVGTGQDRAEDTVGGEDSGQLDCIAEAANTTEYLLLMARDGLLPRHRVATPAHRGFLVFWPHSTAVLEELDGGTAYAVDSWYGANGEAAKVWTLAAWESWETDGEDVGTLLARTGGRPEPGRLP